MSKIKLFCLPYAGGSAAVFNQWRPYVDKNIELQPVELAGRGRRIYDPHYDSIQEAVDDIYGIVKSKIADSNYGLFGHSLGGVIAYELAQKIRTEKLKQPLHVFFAGRGAPHIDYEDDELQFHTLPEEEFKKKIKDLGGTPKEFFEHPELLDVMLPMLRSDFKIAETYQRSKEVNPLDYDISVFIGKKEDVTATQMHGWMEHTTGTCHLHYFEGEHFFINEQPEKVVKLINRTLIDP